MYIKHGGCRKICFLVLLSFSLMFITGCTSKPAATPSPSPASTPKVSATPQPTPKATPTQAPTTPTPTVSANIIAVTGLTIDKEIVNLKVGDSTTLSVTVEPSIATKKSIIWVSGNESVASVSQTTDTTVTVTAKQIGTVLITAESEEGGKLAASIVTVGSVASEVTGVVLNQQELYLTLGASAQIVATVLPENANDKRLTWVSSAPNVAMASEDGTVTAIGIGTAVITVKSAKGNASAALTVRVREAVTAITLKPSAQSMRIGDRLTLSVQIAPATADKPNIVWTSSNAAIATVSNGVITARGVGEAVITAATEDGKISSTCTVYISR